MGQGFHLAQKMALSQVLSPQMQQSLALLQVPTLELRSLIDQELQSNPLLEEKEQSADLSEMNSDLSNHSSKDDRGEESHEDWETEDWEKVVEGLVKLDRDWRDYLYEPQISFRSNADDDQKHQFILDSIPATTSLQETLCEQVRTSDLSKAHKQLAEWLIGNIDEKGYLRASIDELVISTNHDPETIESVLKVIQGFDPPGVATRNLRECLMKQLERDHKIESLEYRLLSECFELLGKRRLSQIAREIREPFWEVEDAIERIRHLNPFPGSSFISDNSPYVVPEIFVKKEAKGFVISTNKDPVPQLRINNTYKDLLSQSQHSANLKTYIREKIRSGNFLIKSIGYRQETIANIANEILKRQLAFFERGVAFLKPMTMGQIAKAIGVHETTVSRAVSGKYLQCQQGIFEMKSFFTSSIQTASGANISNASVKEKISEMLRNEDSSAPLSDEEIVKQLAKKEIMIARRTVAKYRGELNIPSSHLRKTH